MSRDIAESLKGTLNNIEFTIKSFKGLDSFFEDWPKPTDLFTTNTTCSEATEQPAGYAPERFLETPHPDFLCLLCKRVVSQPKECKECQRLVCAACALSQCPNHCAKDSFRPLNDFMASYHGAMQLACANARLGCPAVKSLVQIEMHELRCKYRQSTCSNPFCRKSLSGSVCSRQCTQVLQLQQMLRTDTFQKHNAFQLLVQAKLALYEDAREELLLKYTELDNLHKQVQEFRNRKEALQRAVQLHRTCQLK